MDSDTIKTAERAYLEGLIPYECFVWLMIFRRSFLINNKIEFKPIWFEDTLLCQESFIKATMVLRTHFIHYLYRKRTGSCSSSVNLTRLLDLNKCLSALNELKRTITLNPKVYLRLRLIC